MTTDTATGPQVRPRPIALGELARAAGISLATGAETIITGIGYDSRRIGPGNLFAALPGADFDGHDYADHAIAAGASAVLVERALDAATPQLVVADSRAALAQVAAKFYGHPSRELTVIGLTGTDGKTTTSYLLTDILRHYGLQTGLIGTVGIRIGDTREDSLPHQTTPESNLIHGYLREMVEAGVTHAILESTSHGLAMHRLDGVRFSRAGVTNITHEHLEFHKTIENYRAAKAILVERVADERGVVVLNADDEGAMSLAPIANTTDMLTYSASGRPAHLRAVSVATTAIGSRFEMLYQRQHVPVMLSLFGDFNIANALCAAGIALSLGIPLEEIAAALGQVRGVPGRMLMVNEGQPFSVIVDYAHTPESLTKILSLLGGLHPNGRLIVVSGSAGERDTAKRPLQGAVCQRLADIAIFTNEDPRNEDPDAIIASIAQGARNVGGTEGVTFHRIPDRRAAIAHAFALAAPGDCVLLAGKGHETSIIHGYDQLPWNEEAIARDLLRSLT